MDDDIVFMQSAIDLAHKAASDGEVPVGAILVIDKKIIAQGYNQPIATNDPTAHAEVVALKKGAALLNNYRLLNTTLYVTLEPCVMCVGAMIHARIARVVFGAFDPKGGAITSIINIPDHPKLNHRLEWRGGVLAEECGKILSDFFALRR